MYSIKYIMEFSSLISKFCCSLPWCTASAGQGMLPVSPPTRTIKILNIVIIALHQSHQNYCHKSNIVLPGLRKIWRENLYCVTPLLSGKGYWDMQTWMRDTILFELPPKTTKSKLNSKSCKSEGKAALLNLFTNHPTAIKQILPIIYWLCQKSTEMKTHTIFITYGCNRI